MEGVREHYTEMDDKRLENIMRILSCYPENERYEPQDFQRVSNVACMRNGYMVGRTMCGDGFQVALMNYDYNPMHVMLCDLEDIREYEIDELNYWNRQ